MKITRDEVAHVARLARLEFGEEEIEALTWQMDEILAYVEKLEALETDEIIPTAHAVPVENVFRKDEVRPSIGTSKAVQNAPAAADGCFRVPRVIE